MSGNVKKYRGQASITVSLTSVEEYSVSEYQGSFTLLTPSLERKQMSARPEDTDIEDDDEFLEYSEVTTEQGREERRSGGTQCSTGCALTYHSYKSRRKPSSTPTPPPPTSPTPRERKASKYGAEASLTRKPLEGSWQLVGTFRYRDFLSSVGVAPFSQDLVMRSCLVLRITQEQDRQWRLSTETLIRAKSVKGYRSSNRKWTENKFKAGEAKPEVLEDWDPRFVVTTLTTNHRGDRMSLSQVAEKDMMYRQDSLLELEVDEEDEDVLVVTSSTDRATGWRKFQRKKGQSRFEEKLLMSF